MNPYTVEWLPGAEQELADIWLAAPDRSAVTRAEATITRLLARDPLHSGVEVAEGLRKLIVDPLMLFYSVQQANRKVEVSKVALYPP
jgi:hypothetical protein